MVLHAERRKAVQELRRLAQKLRVQKVPDTASKDAVLRMVHAMLDKPKLCQTDKESVEAAKEVYERTWAEAAGATSGGASQPSGQPGAPTREWKFHAALFTYNRLEGEWGSIDAVVLRGLFDRFIVFSLI